MGSSQSSELGAALVANPTARGVSYVASQFDRRGIAGSSILEADWLSAVDRTSGAFGALTATGHFAGVAFNLVIVLLLLRLLLRTQFRQSKTCFVLMSKASGVHSGAGQGIGVRAGVERASVHGSRWVGESPIARSLCYATR